MGSGNFFDSGLQAYRTGDYGNAVMIFLKGLEQEKDHWEMRLYLGMAYARVGNALEAKKEFMSVRDFARDPDHRRKANAALQALSPNASGTNIKKLSEHAKSTD
ncbi:MAG TPA: hypothetical protein V6D22_17780 [Candidatus Obscuribacterales bacterium]